MEVKQQINESDAEFAKRLELLNRIRKIVHEGMKVSQS